MISLKRPFLLNPGSIAALLLGLMFFLMVTSALHKPLAYDEPNNLYYGHQVLTLGPSTVPDGQRMPILALNALSCLPFHCDNEVLNRSELKRFAVRWPGMLFALLTGWLIFKWGSRLFSPRKALLPLALYCLNPNFIAHGKQLTTDMHEVFFVFGAVYCFWLYFQNKSLKNLFLCSLMTGLAIVSKYSGLLLVPIFTILSLIHFQPYYLKRENLARTLACVFFAGIMIWFVINAGYLFSGTFTKASEYPWQSKKYQQYSNLDIPIPAPKVFMLGMDYTQYLEENPNVGRGNNYIFEKRRRKGRWYVFPVMIGLKTPLSFFILLGIALSVRSKTRGKTFLLIPFALWLLMFSLLCDAQLGIRYVLPGFTFLFLVTGYLFEKEISRGIKNLLAALTAWYAVSSLSYHPHSISYFNELIGSRVNAYKYLADSNLDWEDKTYFLKKFQSANPQLNVNIKPTPQTTGYFVLAANDYTGVLDEREYEFLRNNFKPLRHITYSHFLFFVPPDLTGSENQLKKAGS